VLAPPTVNITNSVTSVTGNSGFSGGNVNAMEDYLLQSGDWFTVQHKIPRLIIQEF
jgi:hypothetical protein